MIHRVLAVLAAVFLLSTAQAATAQVVIENPIGNSNVFLDNINLARGETLTPPNAGPLTDLSVWAARLGTDLEFQPFIYEWDGAAPVGAAVWTGPVTLVNTVAYTEQAFTPNVTLDPLKTYVIVFRHVSGDGGLSAATVNNHAGNLVFSNDGVTWTSNVTAELQFRATFAPLAPAAVPTMTEWAMILMGLILAGGAVLTLQRRRSA